MSSPAARPIDGAPASQPVFPDEILEEIFLRLDAAADLARTSAACTTFRRVVSARRFRHRFRSLHPAPVLGFLELDAPGAFHPAEPPHGSAPAARALAQAADFNFSFLGTPNCWRVCDSRDGRVLLYRRVSIAAAFADLVVCDPLHRRHVQLPPIPDDLAAATGGWGFQEFDPFLDPATDKEKEEEDLSFQAQAIVEVGEGRLGIVIVGDDAVLELYSKTLGNRNNGVDTEECQHDKTIPLPQMDCYWRSIVDAAEGHLLLQATPRNPSSIQSATPESH